ncbi:MAG TPA: hypothetical protein VEU28_05175, partial [Actinomycetota bacterium]|nr:hypothetical protein [Actinomycetota bacterium]
MSDEAAEAGADANLNRGQAEVVTPGGPLGEFLAAVRRRPALTIFLFGLVLFVGGLVSVIGSQISGA